MIKKNLKTATIMLLNVLLIFSMVATLTFSAFTANAKATGIIKFDKQYNLLVAKSTNTSTNIESSNIELLQSFLSGTVIATINLTDSNSGAIESSINNGTITGNFKKYDWGIEELDFNNESLVYIVYAYQNYTYYPQLKLTINYQNTIDGFNDVHLSFNTTQNQVFSIRDEQGIYYSYMVMSGTTRYLVTYPKQSIVEEGVCSREVTCIPISNNGTPLSYTGIGINNENYRLVLNDIINGVYFDSTYTGNVTLVSKFIINPTFSI